MEPVAIEFISRDRTKEGMQSVIGNMTVLEKCIQNNTLILRQLEKALKEMQAQFAGTTKTVSDQTENIAMVETLKKEIDELKAKLIELEQIKKKGGETPIVHPSVPRAATSQFNGLGMSIQQAARELPSLTMGANMFFLAISNNLPILADNIKVARAEVKALNETGQKSTPVWKQVASSIFSWQTALVVGITLLTVYGKEIGEWAKSLFKAKDAVKGLLSAEQEMALARKKSISDSTKERTELDLLYNKLRNTTISTQERNAAVSEWMKKYPQHSNIMNGELVSLGKLDSSYQSLSKQIIETAKARAYSDKITGLETKKNDTLTKRQNQYVTYLKAIEEQNKAVDEYNKKEKTGFGTATAKIDAKDKIFRAEQNAKDQKKAWLDLIEVTNAYDKSISIIAKNIKVDDLFPQAKEGTYDYWQQQVQIADTALKQIASKQKKILDNAAKEPKKDLYALGIDKSIVDSYKTAVKAKKEAEKELEAYPSSSESTKQENQAEKLREQQEKLMLLTNKQALEQSRSEQDLQNQVDQARIDVMKDGSVKTLAQMQLSHKKEMQQFEREKEDKLRKAIEDARAIFDAEEDAKKTKNPKYTKKTFDASGVKLSGSDTQKYGEQENFIGKKQKRETEEYYKSIRDSYQDYTDKRIAIEEKFNTDIATLQEARKKYEQEGNTEKVQQTDRAIAQATTNKGKDLMGLDYEQLKQTPDYVRAFENLKETSSDTLDSLLSQLENAKQTAAEVLSPDQLREYTTTIQEIMDELDSRNPFGALADRKKELAEAEAELATAQQQLNAVQGGAQIVTGVKNTKLNDKTGKIESEKTYLTTTKAMENYNKAQDNVAKKGAKVEKAEKEVKDVMDDLFDSIKDVGDAIGGPAGEIISLIGDIGLFAMTAMSGVSTASETASKSIQAVEKASVILAIIGAAIQIAMKIASLFKDDDGVAAYEKAKDVYESYIDILDRVIEKQKELFELNSKTGEQAYEKAKETVKLQEDASRDLGKQYLDSGASFSSSSEGVKQRDDMSDSGWGQWDAFAGSIGMDPNDIGDRMTGLFDLSAKQLADLQDKAPLFWAELHDDTQKYLLQIIDCNEELTQLEKDRNEGLTKIDFESFYSGFLDTLSDMDASSEDFANSFEDYLKNAILSSLITNEYKTRIQALYDNWASYTESGEKLTEQEVEALRKEQEAISEEMLRKREELAKTFGWQSETEKEQQSGKAGAFTTMSQDQGAELKGLFTMLQIHTKDIDDTVKDIAMVMYEAFDVLLRIEANTAYCKHLEQMAADIAELKRDGFKMK